MHTSTADGKHDRKDFEYRTCSDTFDATYHVSSRLKIQPLTYRIRVFAASLARI